MKIALCIGINDYDFASKLKNPLNDSRDMQSKLIELGFNVILSENKNRVDLLRDINEFKTLKKNAYTSVVFYAGHGIQSKGINYLIPKDANPQNEGELDIFCIQLNELIEQDDIDEYKTNILIFDSCRNNPFERTWSRGVDLLGFAPVLAPSGTLIAFSTSPGKTASDGHGNNGLYTGALLTEITKLNLSIIQVFQNVRQKVLFHSNNHQLPWESTSLLGDFYFNSKSFNPSDTRVIVIRKLIAKIDNMRFRMDKKEIGIMDESTEGGLIYSYSLNGELMHVEKQLFFEMGRHFEDIYFNSNIPVYYRTTEHHYNVPIYMDSERAKEIGGDYFKESETKIIITEHFINDNIVFGFNKIEDQDSTVDEFVNSSPIIKRIRKIMEQSKK